MVLFAVRIAVRASPQIFVALKGVYRGLCRGYIGIMEQKMETTT